jgi:hypothetical protein
MFRKVRSQSRRRPTFITELLQRWDTPQHVIIDDPELSAEKTEIWLGML